MADIGTRNKSSVNLVVKVTNLAAADLVIEGANDWTVGQLKERISALLPSRPAINQQKLVYYGKLLEDRQTLVDALKQNTFGGSHTIHLVVTGCASNQDVAASSHPAENSQQQTSASRSASLNDDAYAFNTMYSQPPWFFGYQPPSSTMTTPGWPAEVGSHASAQQYLWMQLYTQQMQYWHALFQHQTQMAGGRSGPAVATDTETVPINASIPGVVPHLQEQAAAPAPAAAAAARDRDVVRMNAQGGEDEADGGENQDVLDWLYMGMRALLLFCILYFYSSLGRLMLVFTVGMALWMFRGGHVRGDGAARGPAAAAREPRAPVVEQQPVPDRQLQPAPDQLQPDNRNPELLHNGTVNPTVAAGRSILAVAASVVGNFFATLIPHHPPAGNLN